MSDISLDLDKIVELVPQLEKLSRSFEYLKILRVGMQTAPAFHGEIDSLDATDALIEAFFLANGKDGYEGITDLQESVERAAMVISRFVNVYTEETLKAIGEEE